MRKATRPSWCAGQCMFSIVLLRTPRGGRIVTHMFATRWRAATSCFEGASSLGRAWLLRLHAQGVSFFEGRPISIFLFAASRPGRELTPCLAGWYPPFFVYTPVFPTSSQEKFTQCDHPTEKMQRLWASHNAPRRWHSRTSPSRTTHVRHRGTTHSHHNAGG